MVSNRRRERTGTGRELGRTPTAHRRGRCEPPVTPTGQLDLGRLRERETVVRSPIPREDLAADVPLRSAIILPLGDHGLLGCAARGTSSSAIAK
ncbi:hypothetical protein D8S78_06470 [Natrialba swarupiae]|nr:hypothetical protein [Natrialba swarupiae]